MCDYSIAADVRSRPARVSDKLITTAFGSTVGFSAQDDRGCAVCLQPGTELAFDEPTRVGWLFFDAKRYETAIFRQKDMDKDYVHHDLLEFPDGRRFLLTLMATEIKATVLQLPAKPKLTKEELLENIAKAVEEDLERMKDE